MIKLSRQQIKDIADDLDMGQQCYYHIPTGKVVTIIDVDDGAFDDDTMEELEKEKEDIFENRSDYFEFEKMPSHLSFSNMEDFIETVTDKRLVYKLINALNNRKPFRHFKDIILDSDYRDKWFKFNDNCNAEWIENQIYRYNSVNKNDDKN